MDTIIPIPSLTSETRIGQAFNVLFNVINITESTGLCSEVIWDFSGSQFFHPFLIAGLSIYKNKCERSVKVRGLDEGTARYLDFIHFDSILELHDREQAKELMERYGKKTYIPICKFLSSEGVIESVTTVLQSIIEAQVALPAEVRSALSYLMGELVDNIHEHSGSEYGFMFSQFLQREGCINLCIADNGVSIYGSFVRRGKLECLNSNNEGDVLNMALSHWSTKNRPEAENRGYGLPTTKNMLATGMGGSFFILSGNAFHRHTPLGCETVVLPDNIGWDGTIILLKIPVNVPMNFKYLNYV